MKPLPETRKKSNCYYRQVKRSARTAMYSLSYSENGKIVGFDVFKIIIKPAGIVLGKQIPEREHFPSDEEFGSIAWSFTTRETAEVKYNDLERRP